MDYNQQPWNDLSHYCCLDPHFVYISHHSIVLRPQLRRPHQSVCPEMPSATCRGTCAVGTFLWEFQDLKIGKSTENHHL